jgi:hypothetical protein
MAASAPMATDTPNEVASMNAVVHGEQGRTVDAAVVAFAGLGLTFAAWWTYFAIPWADVLDLHRERSFVWGYGHMLIFAALAASRSLTPLSVAELLAPLTPQRREAPVADHGQDRLEARRRLVRSDRGALKLGLIEHPRLGDRVGVQARAASILDEERGAVSTLAGLFPYAAEGVLAAAGS